MPKITGTSFLKWTFNWLLEGARVLLVTFSKLDPSNCDCEPEAGQLCIMHELDCPGQFPCYRRGQTGLGSCLLRLRLSRHGTERHGTARLYHTFASFLSSPFTSPRCHWAAGRLIKVQIANRIARHCWTLTIRFLLSPGHSQLDMPHPSGFVFTLRLAQRASDLLINKFNN